MIAELTGFQLKVDLRSGHDTYEAWREGIHDDLVLAVAIAAWYAEREAEARFQAAEAELQALEWEALGYVRIGAQI
jgi:hypothetical protein